MEGALGVWTERGDEVSTWKEHALVWVRDSDQMHSPKHNLLRDLGSHGAMPRRLHPHRENLSHLSHSRHDDF
jgi:hypothetical protein